MIIVVEKKFQSAFLTVLALLYCVNAASHFRCHCNEPTCVRTAYLCKSQMGCYVLKTPPTLPSPDWSDLDLSSTNRKRRPASNRRRSSSSSSTTTTIFKYGCIEFLADDLTYKCWSDDVLDLLKNPNKIRISPRDFSGGKSPDDRRQKSSTTDQKLSCCFDDLCNNDFERNGQISKERKISDQENGAKNEDSIDPTLTPNQESVDHLIGFYNPTLILILLFICLICLFLMARLVYHDFYSTSGRHGKERSSGSTKNQILINDQETGSAAADQDQCFYYDEQNINWQSARLDEKLKTFTLLMSNKNDRWLDAAKNGGER